MTSKVPETEFMLKNINRDFIGVALNLYKSETPKIFLSISN
jgi:hypothetical protein